jgi:hypothetical protein
VLKFPGIQTQTANDHLGDHNVPGTTGRIGARLIHLKSAQAK